MEKLLLEMEEEDLTILSNSVGLSLYFNECYALLINEEKRGFFILNDVIDHPFWGELDRISISSYEEENDDISGHYEKISDFIKPKILVLGHILEMESLNTGRTENFLSEYGIVIETDEQKVLIFCDPSQINCVSIIANDLNGIKQELKETNATITRRLI